MKGVQNSIINDFNEINYLIDVLLDLTTDKRMVGLLKRIKRIVEGYNG